MRLLFSIIVTMLMANVVCAADFSNPLVQGQVLVKGQAAPSGLGESDTVSLGAVRLDTGELLFCAPAGPGAIAEGMTSVIGVTTDDIFIVFYAYPGPDCSPLEFVPRSAASADRYRVIFGAPGQPLLVEIVTFS